MEQENQNKEESLVQPEVILPKAKTNWAIIVLFTLIGIIIGFGVFFLSQYLLQSKKLDNTQPPIVTAKTEPQTTDWKTYNGALFSYKYPAGLFIKERSQNSQLFYLNSIVAETSENCIENNLGTATNPCSYPTLEIKISKLNDASQIPTNTTDISLPIYLTYVNSEGLTIVKNKEAIGGMGLSVVLEGYVVKDNIPYKITLQTDPAEETKVNINDWETLNKILSTFKFIYQTDSTDTSNWKTYTNTKYGFSINYPTDWAYREFPNTKDGAGFRLESEPNDLTHEHIIISYSKRGSDDLKTPFDTYVKQAAVKEIQNYLSLVSINEVKTNSNVTGYKTTWNVQEMGQPNGKTYISLPITYFDTKDSFGGTIQIRLEDINYLDLYNQILSTFKFN